MMKKITPIFVLLAALCLTVIESGCDKQRTSEQMDYTVTCTLDSKLHHDSATLLVLEEDYNKLRICSTAHAVDNTFTFKGQIDGPKVGIIRWDNDSTRPFYFVLEPGHINFAINVGSWSVSGSAQNKDYQQFINQRNHFMNARVATWQEYLKAASTSSLKHEDEVRMVRQDSLLNDSLQQLMVERINRGDAVGRIIRERFAGQLDKAHVGQLK